VWETLVLAERKLPDFAELSTFVVCRTRDAYPIDESVKAIGIFHLGERLGL
jgi:hypothetical protein